METAVLKESNQATRTMEEGVASDCPDAASTGRRRTTDMPDEMARPASTRRLERAPIGTIVYEKQPLPELFCPICSEILQEACSPSHCGHWFCDRCLREHLENNGGCCPICSESCERHRIVCQHVPRALISNLKVHCRYGLVQSASGEWLPAESDDPQRCPGVFSRDTIAAHEHECSFAMDRFSFPGYRPEVRREESHEEEAVGRRGPGTLKEEICRFKASSAESEVVSQARLSALKQENSELRASKAEVEAMLTSLAMEVTELRAFKAEVAELRAANAEVAELRAMVLGLEQQRNDTTGLESRDEVCWERLPGLFLSLLTSRLSGPGKSSARLACKAWSVGITGSCHELCVKGDGPAGWGLNFLNVEDLQWNLAGNLDARRAFQDIEQLSRLKRLSLCTSFVWKKTYSCSLKQLSKLATLDLSGCLQISSAEMAELRHLSALTDLDLSFCTKINHDGMRELGHLPALTSLNMSYCNQITDAVVAELKHLSALTSLDLPECYMISDKGVAELRHLPALTRLDLSFCSQITDTGAAELRHLSALTSLEMCGCTKITDLGVAELRHLSALKELSLAHCSKVTDAGMARIRSLKGLARLNLSGCDMITAAGLAELRCLSSLANLDLSECDMITDAVVAELRHLKALNQLNLSFCKKITDAGVAELRHLSALKKVILSRKLWGRAGVAMLKESLPVNIVFKKEL